MKIGKLVELAVDLFEDREVEAAMMLACIAVDGTGRRAYPELADASQRRFVKLLRDNRDVLGPMAMPGFNIADTRLAVRVRRPTAEPVTIGAAEYSLPDAADVLYAIHRCTHGHGDELDAGFALIPDTDAFPGLTRLTIDTGTVRFSDRTVMALLAVVVLCEANIGQEVPDGYALWFESQSYPINEWWGRRDEFYEQAIKPWGTSPGRAFLPTEESIKEAGLAQGSA